MSKPSFSEMVSAVENKVVDLLVYFENYFGGRTKYPIDIPKAIRFTLKGTTAGYHHFYPNEGTGELEFNPILMEENWGDFDQTIIHETAHYCTALLHGIVKTQAGRVSHHGKEWKQMMAFFGADIRRCHKYDVTNARVRKPKREQRWRYVCDCMTHQIPTRTHNKMKKGLAMYKCRHCNGRIRRPEGAAFNGTVRAFSKSGGSK